MTIIIYLLLIFLSVIGLCDLIHIFRVLLIRPKKDSEKVLLCFLNDEGAELQLAFVIEQYKWHGNKYCDKIVAVDCQKDAGISEECSVFAQKYGIEFIRRDELSEFVDTEIEF